MKANEVPEKIYINDFGSELSYDWHTEHCCESDIEYTRTDVFIEKACTFLKDRIVHDSIDYPMARMSLIDDFEEYLKK